MKRKNSRVQLIVWTSLAVIVSLIILSFSTPSTQSQTGKSSETSWYESAVFFLLSPFQRMSLSVQDSIARTYNKYFYLVGVSEQNTLLQAQINQLEQKTLLLDNSVSENKRLRELLDIKQASEWKTLSAKVIGYNPQAEFRLVTINRGSSSQIQERMPVISSSGLVGQVYRVSRHASQVLLITDPTSAVDTRLVEKGTRGLVRGRILSALWDRSYYLTAWEYVDSAELIDDGHLLVTTGLDGVFPEGIPVGMIQNIRENPYGIFQEADVVPKANLMALREVLVVLDWDKE